MNEFDFVLDFFDKNTFRSCYLVSTILLLVIEAMNLRSVGKSV